MVSELRADSSVHDHTVPYPTAAIEITDHFLEWEEQGLEIDVDDDGIIQSWDKPIEPGYKSMTKKGSWRKSIGTLPPPLRYRFPFNYVSGERWSETDQQIILLLFPILLPVLIVLM